MAGKAYTVRNNVLSGCLYSSHVQLVLVPGNSHFLRCSVVQASLLSAMFRVWPALYHVKKVQYTCHLHLTKAIVSSLETGAVDARPLKWTKTSHEVLP